VQAAGAGAAAAGPGAGAEGGGGSADGNAGRGGGAAAVDVRGVGGIIGGSAAEAATGAPSQLLALKRSQ
jgi:hypothetical protein